MLLPYLLFRCHIGPVPAIFCSPAPLMPRILREPILLELYYGSLIVTSLFAMPPWCEQAKGSAVPSDQPHAASTGRREQNKQRVRNRIYSSAVALFAGKGVRGDRDR